MIKGEAQNRAATTYNAASDTYDSPANTFWAKFGRRTVERLNLKPGERVLDVCSGSGASAIPAAEAVGPKGSVTGVDLSEKLMELARGKAKAEGLRNIEFKSGDMLELPFADAQFDAVVCVFGVFFVPDMPVAVRSLWRVVRPGGRLAITTWGPRFFEPATGAFWNAVRAERQGPLQGGEAVAEAGEHPIPDPEASGIKAVEANVVYALARKP
jgi:ubiquinone/menaquinone biosynthesis C-methylase UbiE